MFHKQLFRFVLNDDFDVAFRISVGNIFQSSTPRKLVDRFNMVYFPFTGHFKKAVDDFEEALKHKEDFEDARMGLEASQKALHWL